MGQHWVTPLGWTCWYEEYHCVHRDPIGDQYAHILVHYDTLWSYRTILDHTSSHVTIHIVSNIKYIMVIDFFEMLDMLDMNPDGLMIIFTKWCMIRRFTTNWTEMNRNLMSEMFPCSGMLWAYVNFQGEEYISLVGPTRCRHFFTLLLFYFNWLVASPRIGVCIMCCPYRTWGFSD